MVTERPVEIPDELVDEFALILNDVRNPDDPEDLARAALTWLAERGELAAARPRIATSMVEAVRGDLEALGDAAKGGAKASLRSLAMYLAEVIDLQGTSAGPAASARLAQELRATLTTLTTGGADGGQDSFAEFLERIGTPSKAQQ